LNPELLKVLLQILMLSMEEPEEPEMTPEDLLLAEMGAKRHTAAPRASHRPSPAFLQQNGGMSRMMI